MKKTLDWQKYIEKAAQTVSEGIVMLRNKNNALPLAENDVVSVFGRIQLHYYKSGTGSGGMVNVSKVTGIVDGLIEGGVRINEELLKTYTDWDEKNPYNTGEGWGAEPWSQEEMPLSEDVVSKAASLSNKAVVIIGRTAGEEQDSTLTEGSYLLTASEKDMLIKVRDAFDSVIVLLNVGGLIDLTDIEACNPDSVLYVWQGGMTGGIGVADILTGKTSPSGKLPDTIAYSIEDYPSSKYFGDKHRNFYSEDIFVGYRYFETFAKEKVRYPFGFGLSYTSFLLDTHAKAAGNAVDISVNVRNVGDYCGKEVVQVYCEAPQGKLGKASRVLCGFAKTPVLSPDEDHTVRISVDLRDIASYDDSGVTGHRFCYVLEEGDYTFYVGTDSRSASKAITLSLSSDIVTEKCSQAMAPVETFERFSAVKDGDAFSVGMEKVPLNEVDEGARRVAHLPEEIVQTGDRGIKLADVLSGTHTMDEFIAQLTDEDLMCIIRGEGMGSPRVTAGTASAFGGVTDRLSALGIPAACCSDGPSGMRLDCGTKAFSLPNGTLIASTFNTELVGELFELLGLEMCANKVDCLLGPGMNIHRNVLNGRNFEYFSEDPFLTGTMAAAELNGLHKSGVTGTIKHFCGNNQETNRHYLDSAVSERALREIYLKGFEIAVKQGNADSIMTTYGAVNGLWTAGNYDLNTTILRDEWGFSGFTMTDWWANINDRGQAPDRDNFAAMARAQNDVYMVCADSSEHEDTTAAALADGTLTRAELQRNAKNICNFLLYTNAMKRLIGVADEIEIINRPADEDDSMDEAKFYEIDDSFTLDLSGVKSVKGKNYSFSLIQKQRGWYRVTVAASSEQSELAQIPVTIFAMGTPSAVFTWNGTGGKVVEFSSEIPMFSRFTAIRLYFAQNGLDLHSIKFELVRKAEDMNMAFANVEE